MAMFQDYSVVRKTWGSSNPTEQLLRGCLLIKFINTIILFLGGEKLGCDELQFGYQTNTSTVIDYNSNSKAVYGCALDMSKALDLVE